MAEETRLKRFVQDQEEAVQLARSTPEGSDSVRVDAINVALSLAHCNAEPGTTVTTAELIECAKAIERYLRSS
jgi:hypothetical protein